MTSDSASAAPGALALEVQHQGALWAHAVPRKPCLHTPCWALSSQTQYLVLIPYESLAFALQHRFPELT